MGRIATRSTVLSVLVIAGSVAVLAFLFDRSGRTPRSMRALLIAVNTGHGDGLVEEARAMSPNDVAQALSCVLDVRINYEFDAAGQRCLADCSEECRWAGMRAATLLAVKCEPRAGDTLKVVLSRCFVALQNRPDYTPVENHNRIVWQDSSQPLENYLWALVRIEGIRGFEWVRRETSSLTGQPVWAKEAVDLASVLSWAEYRDQTTKETWPGAKPSGFDAEWVFRFVAAAREHGYTVDLQSKDTLMESLVPLLEGYSPATSNFDNLHDLQRYWLAASASMALAELDERRGYQREFPLGFTLIMCSSSSPVTSDHPHDPKG